MEVFIVFLKHYNNFRCFNIFLFFFRRWTRIERLCRKWRNPWRQSIVQVKVRLHVLFLTSSCLNLSWLLFLFIFTTFSWKVPPEKSQGFLGHHQYFCAWNIFCGTDCADFSGWPRNQHLSLFLSLLCHRFAVIFHWMFEKAVSDPLFDGLGYSLLFLKNKFSKVTFFFNVSIKTATTTWSLCSLSYHLTVVAFGSATNNATWKPKHELGFCAFFFVYIHNTFILLPSWGNRFWTQWPSSFLYKRDVKQAYTI